MKEPGLNASLIVRREFQKLFPGDTGNDIDDIPLADLGVDSLDFFEKVLFLEEEYGVKVSLSELDNNVTLKDVLSSVDADAG